MCHQRPRLTTHALVFPIITHECKSQTAKKADRKRVIHLKHESLENSKEPWTARKMNQWVLEQIKPETWPEVKMTKMQSSYFGHVMRRQGSLGKAIILRKTGGGGKDEDK